MRQNLVSIMDGVGSRLRGNERAVSTQIAHVLTVVITVVIATGLMTSMAAVVESQSEDATETELQIVGERISASLHEADQLAQQSDGDFQMVLDLPQQAGTGAYSVQIKSSPGPNNDVLVLKSHVLQDDIRIPMNIETTLDTTGVGGGNIAIEYDGDAITIKEV